MTSPSIDFDSILDQLNPGVLIETDMDGGLQGLPGTTKTLLMVGPSNNLNGEVRRITSRTGAVNLWGAGTPLACMAEAALKTAPKATLYGMSVAPGTGNATLTGTYAGSATASGVIKVWVGGRYFEVAVANGDAATAVRDATVDAAAADSSMTNSPAEVANGVAAAAVDFDAVLPGKIGNSIRVRVDVSNVPGITIDLGSGAVSTADEKALASGATDTDPGSDLEAIEAERFHLVALASEDSTALDSLKDHMTAQSTPAAKKWGIGIGATILDSASAQSLADGIDSTRMQLVWLYNSPRPTFEVAAAFAALRAVKDPRQEIDDAELSWLMPPFSSADWAAPPDVEAGLDEGLTPLKCERQGGRVKVSRSIVTAHGTTLGQTKAYDATIYEKSDYTDETVLAALAAYKGATWKTASPAGRPSTVTPSLATSIVAAALVLLDSEDYLQGFTGDGPDGEGNYIDQGLVVAQANPTNPDRVDAAFPFHPTRSAHLWAIKKTYTY